MHVSSRLFSFVLLLTLASPAASEGIDCASIGVETRVSEEAAEYTRNPSLVWTGAGYGVAWSDHRYPSWEMFFARLDENGFKIGPDIRVTDHTGSASVPSLAWTGSEYGLAWDDYRLSRWEIFFARFDASGSRIGDDVRLTNTTRSRNPSLVWTGQEYGIAWERTESGRTRVYFGRRSLDGTQLGTDIEVHLRYGGTSRYPSLVWTGSEYGLAYTATVNGAISFVRIDADGIPIIEPLSIVGPVGAPGSPSLAWTGTGYRVAVHDRRSGGFEIWIVRLDAAGNSLGEDVPVVNNPASSRFPSLVSSGTDLGLAWYDFEGGREEIFFTNLDLAGTDIGDDLRLTNDPDYDGEPTLVWADGVYSVAWTDLPNVENASIRFARIACGCLSGVDPDDDGVGMPCDNCPATPNPDQTDFDRDGEGDACDACVDLDHDGFGDPGFPANLCLTDNCPEIWNPSQVDIDEDEWGLICDCDDTNPAMNAGHPEYNDGLDNDCDGLTDEGSALAKFCCDDGDPPTCTQRFCWPGSVGATRFEAAHADDRWFTEGCDWMFTGQRFWEDPAEPDPGEGFFYLHRPTEPWEGSWGPIYRYWPPYERFPTCLP